MASRLRVYRPTHNENGRVVQRLRLIDLTTLNIFWIGLNFLWNSLHSIILPVRILDLAPEHLKGTALGLITFLGLILAMVYQPIIGAVSDASTLKWGRRRPFILVGTFFNIIFLTLLLAAGNLWLLFAWYMLLQLSSNTAEGPYQGIIPDLVPEDQRGEASGIKQIIEILGAVLSTFIAGYLMERGLIWAAGGVIVAALLASVAITAFTTHEEPGVQVNGKPLLSHARATFNVDVRQHSDYMWLLLSRFFIFVGLTAVQIFSLYFIKDVIRAPNYTELAGSLTAIVGAAILLIVYPAGYLSDRVGRKPLLIFSGLMATVGVLLFLTADSLTELLIYGGTIGLAMGIFLSSNWAFATDLIPRAEAARYMGIANVATCGGSAAARLGGPLLDFFNARQEGLGYGVLFRGIALCFFVGALVLLRVHEWRRPQSKARASTDPPHDASGIRSA